MFTLHYRRYFASEQEDYETLEEALSSGLCLIAFDNGYPGSIVHNGSTLIPEEFIGKLFIGSPDPGTDEYKAFIQATAHEIYSHAPSSAPPEPEP